MVIAPMIASPVAAKRRVNPSSWPDVGLMSGEAFLKPWIPPPKEAAWILVQIGHLYRIEAELRKQGAGVALRDAYRSSQSRPVIRRIQQALERWQSTQTT